MAIDFLCPGCRAKLRGAFRKAGTVIACPGCGINVTVPGLPPRPVPKPPPSPPAPTPAPPTRAPELGPVRLYHFTGQVTDYHRQTDTRTYGRGMVTTGGGRHPGVYGRSWVETEHTHWCDFWVVRDDGREEHLCFDEWVVPVRDGQRVSVVYAAHASTGDWLPVALVNHSAGTVLDLASATRVLRELGVRPRIRSAFRGSVWEFLRGPARAVREPAAWAVTACVVVLLGAVLGAGLVDDGRVHPVGGVLLAGSAVLLAIPPAGVCHLLLKNRDAWERRMAVLRQEFAHEIRTYVGSV